MYICALPFYDHRIALSNLYKLLFMKSLNGQPEFTDIKINILDNNEILSWIKKWNIYPFQFMEAYYNVKEKTIQKIEEYLSDKGLINTTISNRQEAI